MAFFNTIGKRISDVSQNVSQQTKNFADISKLNSAISEKETKVDNLYTQLGKVFYENYSEYYLSHPEQAGPEVGLLTEIRSILSAIADDRKAIDVIRGVTSCPNCGTSNARDAIFCSGCGVRIVRTEDAVSQPVANTSACPKCGAILEEGSIFCTACGTKLVEE